MSALPRFAPDFRIAIDGTPVPNALRNNISSVSLQTGLEGADRVELSLANEGLRWIDHPLFRSDRELSLAMGYASDPLQQMFVGEIVSQSASFPSSGLPGFSVVAQDRRQRMQKGNRARWFATSIPNYANVPVLDPLLAAGVAASYGLVPITDPVGAAIAVLLGGAQVAIAQAESASDPSDPDKAQKTMRVQAGESDLDFLARIARENGWDMSMDHDGPLGGRLLRFGSPADHLESEVHLKWGRDLVDFSPRISDVGQVAAVRVFVWQPSEQQAMAVTVGWDWDRQSLTLAIAPAEADDAASGSDPQLLLIGQPVTLADAPRTILGELLPRLNKRQTASGNTIGDPRIRAGTVIQVEGVGERFGGLYRVTSAHHTLDGGGWKTSFECRKDIWFGSIPLPEQGAVPVRINV
jgi:phage protein D